MQKRMPDLRINMHSFAMSNAMRFEAAESPMALATLAHLRGGGPRTGIVSCAAILAGAASKTGRVAPSAAWRASRMSVAENCANPTVARRSINSSSMALKPRIALRRGLGRYRARCSHKGCAAHDANAPFPTNR
jgi:hypothetical protein